MVNKLKKLLSLLAFGGAERISKGWKDEGSTLGQFWFKLVSKIGQNLTKTLLFTSILTRATIGIGICISLLSVPILKRN